jgi:DNA-binding CsgD family transcriptional regulator
MVTAAEGRPDDGATGNRMQDAERRFNHWVDLVDHLLACPDAGFPTGMLTAQLVVTFDTNAAWNWIDSDGGYGFDMYDQPPGWPSPAEVQFWTREAMPEHPLPHWYMVSGDTSATTIGRVPRSVGTRRGREMVSHCLAPVGLDRQLAIPYRVGPAGQRVFVLATTGADYSDEQVALARRIQPLLVLLARNEAVLERCRPAASVVPLQRAAGLTGREVAVLRLLAEGLTAESIGRRLGVSRHTVRKHLEHVYRKLGVTDRLVAVREARAQGLLEEPFEERTGG